MCITADNVAAQWAISLEEPRTFAAASQIKAIVVIRDGRFKNEIVLTEIPRRHGTPMVFDTDKFPQEGNTAAALSELRPAFKQNGSVTAAHADSASVDQRWRAAAVPVIAASVARGLGRKPLARIAACAKARVNPKIMGTDDPIPVARACLKKAGWTVDQLDLNRSQ